MSLFLMESSLILEQILQQYGLIGFLIAFIVLGPWFTYVKTKNAEAKAEAKARELLNDFARHEQQRADRLEGQLNAAQAKLDCAENDVMQFNVKLFEAQKQVEELTAEVARLSGIIDVQKTDNQLLRDEIRQREQRILKLEQALIQNTSLASRTDEQSA